MDLTGRFPIIACRKGDPRRLKGFETVNRACENCGATVPISLATYDLAVSSAADPRAIMIVCVECINEHCEGGGRIEILPLSESQLKERENAVVSPKLPGSDDIARDR